MCPRMLYHDTRNPPKDTRFPQDPACSALRPVCFFRRPEATMCVIVVVVVAVVAIAVVVLVPASKILVGVSACPSVDVLFTKVVQAYCHEVGR